MLTHRDDGIFLCFPITGGGERGGAGDQMAGQGVLMPPREPDGPGEMGKAVVLPKELTAEQKKLVDDGWQKNAFNQYVSDMISVHRTLPDPRDDRHVVLLFLLSPIRRFEIGGGATLPKECWPGGESERGYCVDKQS